jgi:hypothetical protein
MKEDKAEVLAFAVKYLYPTVGPEAPGQADAERAGEVVALIETDGKPSVISIYHNFNLSPNDGARHLPDVSFEPEDADFYLLKPTIRSRGVNSVTIELNPESHAFGGSYKPTRFVVKLKRNSPSVADRLAVLESKVK